MGAEKDLDKGACWLVVAKHKGNQQADSALKKLAGDKENPLLQSALHKVYRHGAEGIKSNLKTTVLWLIRFRIKTRLKRDQTEYRDATKEHYDVVQNGSSKIYFALAEAYNKDAVGLPRKKDKARTFYDAASSRGHVQASYMFGRLEE